jgi:hypothetical protein
MEAVACCVIAVPRKVSMNKRVTQRSRPSTLRPELAFAVFLCLVGAMLSGLAPLRAAAAQDAPAAIEIGPISLAVDAVGGVDARALADTNRTAITNAADEFTAIFATTPPVPVALSFGAALDQAQAARMTPISPIAWVATDGTKVHIALDGFLQLTPVEAENQLRNALSRIWMHAASGGNLPTGYAEGIARYVERPVLARQARLGSLVQRAHQAGTLPELAALIGSNPADVDPETLGAARYAVIAFYVNRYGVGAMQDLVAGFETNADWTAVTTDVLGQSLDEIDVAWRDYLPVFFASGWRSNAVAAFDLAPAEALFDRGAYAAAADQAERSQRLFSELGDQTRLSRVEALLAQCAVGVQAEKIMVDAQTALEAHEYDRALTLIGQAEDLYAVLPETHQPVSTLTAWRQMATGGQDAIAQLADASAESDNWILVRQTRADAYDAGVTFAALGDSDRLAEAQSLVTDLDFRLRALILALVGITLIAGAWCAVWLWARAPNRVHWARVTP